MEDTNTNVETKETTDTQESKETKTYTQEEVDALLQREGDKRVSAALKKQQRKFDEAQKLASMSEEEKHDYEYNQKVAELEKREAEIAKKELAQETMKQLTEKGLPSTAAQFLVAVDAEHTNENIKAFEKMWLEAIEGEIKKRIATGTPKAASAKSGAVSKEQFKKMTVAQRSDLYKKDPQLFASLAN